jgi:hypothetical protein
MAYVGQGIKNGTFSVLDTSGNTYNGSNVTFNLGTQVGSPAQLLVSHDGVIQKPVTDYTIATGGTQITFTTAPASGASIFITEISGAVGAPMNRDINGDELILDADGDTSLHCSTDDQIDFRISGADDLRMSANAINVLSGTTLTIDSGATITNSGTANGFGALAGIDDQSSSNDDQLTITDTAVIINEDSDDLDFRVESNGSTHALFIDAAVGSIGIQDDAPNVTQGGITLNQAGDDGAIMELKSSDVAHGITGLAQTDTYGLFMKYSATEGGVNARGLTEADIGFYFQALHTTVNTTTSASGRGGFEISTAKKTGTGKTTTDGNLFAVRNNNSTKFIITEGGDIHSDSGNGTTYDEYDDAHLVRAFDLSKGEKSKGLINSQFDKYIKYNHETLADAGLVGKEDDGTPNHFINVTGMQRLHNGAIWQQYEKHERLLEAVYDLAKEAVGKDKANAILDKHEVKRLQ